MFLDMPIVISYVENAYIENFNPRPNRLNAWSGPDDKYSDPVNMITGNFTWDYTDFAVYGANPLEFTRMYNAQNSGDSEIGYNWRHNYMVALEDTPLYAKVTMPDGYRIIFTKDIDGIYTGPTDVDMSLVSTAGGYLMTYRDNTGYRFDAGGYLVAIEPVNGDTASITRNGAQISSVSNSSGTLTFSYSGGRIDTITDQTGRSVHYSYNGSGDLAAFTNADGDTVSYIYDNHLIKEITDFNGDTYLRNVYDDIGRVTEQYLADQGTSYFEYNFKERWSTIKTYGGGVLIQYLKYYYDTDQRVIGVEDINGRTVYEYENGRVKKVTDCYATS